MKHRIVENRTKANLNPQQKQIAKAVFGQTLGGQILAEAEFENLQKAVAQVKEMLTGKLAKLTEDVKKLDARLTEFERQKGFLNFAGKYFPTSNGQNKATMAGKYFKPADGKGTGVASKYFDGGEQ